MDILNLSYNNLTKSEKKIANYIYDHQQDAQYLSITALAEQCRVGEATIFRFCKSLGFEGYNQFKFSLAKSLYRIQSKTAQTAAPPAGGSLSLQDKFPDLCKKLYQSNVAALAQTLDLFDENNMRRAAELLGRSARVLCIGQGGSMLMAKEAWNRFLSVSSRFSCVEDSHLQAMSAALLGENDAILCYCYSGATREALDVLRPAKERGVRIIMVTRFEKSPAAAFADVVLTCGSNESPLQTGSVEAKMAMLFVTDVLYHEFCRKYPEESARNNEITAGALGGKLL